MPGPAPEINCRPPWCVVDDRRNTVDVWYDELAYRFGCARESICGLMLLAQLSPQGYVEANSIMWKMFKKVCDKEHIGRPSVFLHNSANLARIALQPPREHLKGGRRVDHRFAHQ